MITAAFHCVFAAKCAHSPLITPQVKLLQKNECRRCIALDLNCLHAANGSIPLRFWKCIAAGDLGQTDWTATTLEHLAAYDYDVLLFPGDLSYADTWQPLWDSFGQMMSPYANYRPWMVTEGNHEIEDIPLLVESFLSYNTRWEMPYNESGSSSNLYYSFEVAGVHILMLGSYADFDTNSTQFKWLQVFVDITYIHSLSPPPPGLFLTQKFRTMMAPWDVVSLFVWS